MPRKRSISRRVTRRQLFVPRAVVGRNVSSSPMFAARCRACRSTPYTFAASGRVHASRSCIGTWLPGILTPS
nr:MAG TPA: hypothetical protein [Caudoviricetes sp.]